MAVSAEHGVLLLEAEPCVLRDDVLRQEICQQTPLVGAVRVALRGQDLAQHQHAVPTSNRIRACEHRLQDAVRVVADLLLARAARFQFRHTRPIAAESVRLSACIRKMLRHHLDTAIVDRSIRWTTDKRVEFRGTNQMHMVVDDHEAPVEPDIASNW
ncbi:hypothetical protein Mapa_006069 [Marchantia paleacea]|nr:hypothetical protein Mapa_006069 [Marchantia paleacea]